MSNRRIIPVDMDMQVAMAFYTTIGHWAKAVETGETSEAELQLRKLDLLGRKMAEGESFKGRFAEVGCKLDAIEMLECLRDYLDFLTKVGPSRSDRYQESRTTDS